MAFQRQSADPYEHLADINVTPLVDVMLVLLIIFMVTAPMLHQGVAVALPKTATTNLPSSVEDPIILSITRDGLYYINETPVARALLKDPPILILDEATSALDPLTEQRVNLALDEVMKGRTTFVIAHRLSTVSLADEVVVMDGGRIVDRGTHEELLEGCGFYREIAEHGLADSVFLQRDLERREEVARL